MGLLGLDESEANDKAVDGLAMGNKVSGVLGYGNGVNGGVNYTTGNGMLG